MSPAWMNETMSRFTALDRAVHAVFDSSKEPGQKIVSWHVFGRVLSVQYRDGSDPEIHTASFLNECLEGFDEQTTPRDEGLMVPGDPVTYRWFRPVDKLLASETSL